MINIYMIVISIFISACIIGLGVFLAKKFLFNKKKIVDYMLLKTGKLIKLKPEIKEDTFEYEDSSYITEKDSRVLSNKNELTFLHIEGIPTPVNLNKLDKNSIKDIKIDSASLKKLLKLKLFSDLFSSDSDNIKKMLLEIITVLNFIVSLIIAAKVLGVKIGGGE